MLQLKLNLSHEFWERKLHIALSSNCILRHKSVSVASREHKLQPLSVVKASQCFYSSQLQQDGTWHWCIIYLHSKVHTHVCFENSNNLQVNKPSKWSVAMAIHKQLVNKQLKTTTSLKEIFIKAKPQTATNVRELHINTLGFTWATWICLGTWPHVFAIDGREEKLLLSVSDLWSGLLFCLRTPWNAHGTRVPRQNRIKEDLNYPSSKNQLQTGPFELPPNAKQVRQATHFIHGRLNRPYTY